GLVLLSAMVGQYRVEATDVIKIVFGRSATDAMAESVLWQIRFPRIVLGLLVGASLAVAGAVMQALFSNPLAEPGIIGVSSGAAVG
ncbi:iron chelate uptake ABC transporter family permease subunit, partial [Xanthomonas citri pv. citri]|nr:iron chelate uptake ABC transporter family permease subunit [Xanthomonas citri pv. citri]